MSTPALRLDGVTKSFPGVIALRDVRLEVAPGEVHALVGENGAGKSTLMAIAAGALRPDAGTVSLGGTVVEDPTPARMRELGLAVVYQHPALLPDLTVAENLVLGVQPARRPRLHRAGGWAREQLAQVGLTLDPRRRLEELSVAERHLVEIAKALAAEPSVLVLDEPTEPLAQPECERLFEQIRMATERGVAVVYISHRLRDVERISDRMTVLRDGEQRGTFAVGDLSEDDILRLIVGRPVTAAFPAKRGGDGAVRLEVAGLAGEGFGDVDLTLRGGEIVGLAGIEGNGQRALMRSLAGLVPAHGTLRVDGQRVKLGSPQAALRAGIAYMPADRHGEGLLLPLSVRENVTLLTLGDNASGGIVSRAREQRTVAGQTQALAIKAPSSETPVGSLSGGNQQKTVFARTLLAQPKVILADEPTQGVDAGARLELYRHLRAAADDGAAVVVLSSDAIELEGLCDRVLVLSRGHVVGELAGDHVTEERMTHTALTSTQLRTQRDAAPSRLRRFRRHAAGDYAPSALLMLIALALGAYATTKSDAYLTTINFESYLMLLSLLGFIALGQFTVVMLGGVDLSVGPLAGFLVVVASSTLGSPGSGVILGLGLMLALALAVGLTNGVLVRKVQVTPVIATLVTFFFLQGLSLTIRPTPGGAIDLGIGDALLTSVGFIPVAFIVLVVLVAVLEWRLRFSRWGLELRAVGSEESAAHRLGVDTTRTHIVAYVLCAALTFLGSLVLMAQIGVGDAGAGVEFTLSSIAAVVIGGASIFGGRGSYLGVLCGAVLLQQIANVSTFLQLSSAWQYWFVGALTLLAAGLYSRARHTG